MPGRLKVGAPSIMACHLSWLGDGDGASGSNNIRYLSLQCVLAVLLEHAIIKLGEEDIQTSNCVALYVG